MSKKAKLAAAAPLVKYCGRCGCKHNEMAACPECGCPEFGTTPDGLHKGWKRRRRDGTVFVKGINTWKS